MKAFLRNVCGRMSLAAFVLAVVSAAAQAQTAPVKPSFEGEEGTATVTYIISTTAHMNWFANMVNGEPGYEQNLDANARLTAHVRYDLAGAKAIGGGTEGTEGDKAYNGEFDGGNYTITATTLASNGSYGGFFGHIGANAYIHNLEFAAAGTTGLVHAGGLCGYMDCGARIEDCLIDVNTVTSSESSSTGCAGGIVGHCDNPGNERPIRYCYTTITSLVQGGLNDQYRDNICGTHTGETHPFEYCYYPNNDTYNSTGIGQAGDGFSTSDITGGRTCYLLNRRTSGGDPWREYIGGIYGTNTTPAIIYPHLSNTTNVIAFNHPNGSASFAVKDCKVYFGFCHEEDTEVGTVDGVSHTREFKNNVRYDNYTHGRKPSKIVGREGSSRVTYYISTPMELLYFINLVNGTLDETSEQWQRQNVWASAKLTQNVNINNIRGLFTAIGGTKAYQGDFDGCGYLISGSLASVAPNGRYGGFFGRLGEYARVHDLEITLNAVTGSQYVGGLCGYMDRGARIDNCSVGVTSVESTWSLATGYAGGIVGYCDNSDGSQPITNCFSTPTDMLFTGGENGETCAYNICGGHSHATVHPFQNCYYQDENNTERGFTTEDVTKGYTCYLLNGSKNGATMWKQQSTAPHLRGYSTNANTFRTVFYGYSNSACTGEQSVGRYSTKDADDSNKRYTKLTSGTLVEPTLDSDYDYLLGTTDELLWFINKVNGEGGLTQNASISAKLTADIVLSDEYSNLTSTKAIGGATGAYTGNFDGQGHTITFNNITANGDYGGFFGLLGQYNRIKNLNIKGKKVTGGRYAGGLVGTIGEYSQTLDCSVMVDEVEVTATSGEKYAGTLLGSYSTLPVSLQRCVTKAACLPTDTDKQPYCCLLTGVSQIDARGSIIGKEVPDASFPTHIYSVSVLPSADNKIFYNGLRFYNNLDNENRIGSGQFANECNNNWRQNMADCEAMPYVTQAEDLRYKVYYSGQTCQDNTLLNHWNRTNQPNTATWNAIEHQLVWDAAHSAYKCKNCNTWRLPITKGKLNSICMPVSGVLYSTKYGSFEDLNEQTAQLYDFEMIVGHKVYGTPVAHNKIEPGHPYMYVPREGQFVFFVADNDVVDNINTGEHEHGDHINGMYGVLKDDLVSGSANKNVDGTVQTLNYLDVSGGDYVIFYTDGLRFGNDGNKHYLSYGYCYLKTAEVKYKPEAEEVTLAPSLVHIGNFLDDFEDEMPTAIEAVEAADAADASASTPSTRGLRYNLQGQVVDASYSGIVIVNGKKIFQK